ncbi:E7 [Enhydra lutris papillomavirus 1]|uniref:Protein E7 n=1 Tax=Enhydra lutris papillomavirus 1 TaxID=1472717 RepID=W8R551_9PAPI|nr:E7 [Enhydra lutris papillomavirus 1]AHL83543.1 E7 [Enhydra lutris papillomavirus 1]
MFGLCPTLGEVVLTEQPEAIDLHCYEHMPSDDEEEEEQTSRDLYRVSVDCGACKRTVTLVVFADLEDIQKLHSLLHSVRVVCESCLNPNNLNHGG